MKQGEENTKLVKEPHEETNKYIFQKNRKTKLGAVIVIGFLVIIVIAVMLSGLTI